MSETTGFLSPVIDEQAQWLLKKHIDRIHQLEQQLQQARREGKAEGIRLGWEQAKAEAAAKADELFKYESGYYHYREDVTDAIASMEYKEAQDES